MNDKEFEHIEGEPSRSHFIDAKRERRVVWKLDMFIAPVVMILQLVSFLDRSNIGFAATQGLASDIGLKGSQFNVCSPVAVSIFYIFYILIELPASLVVKRLGFARVIPVIALSWGIICMCTGFIRSYGGLIVTRLLLGLAEGCLFPSLSLFLLNWYKREEMGVRIAYLIGSAALSGAFGGFISFAILHFLKLDGVAGMAGWRWLYIIEGIVTVIFAFACFFLIPKSFETAYFLNEEDRIVMRWRAEISEAYNGGTGHFTRKDLNLALTDKKLYISGFCQFFTVIVQYGFGTFLPIIIKNGLHFSTVQAQWLTIPVYIWGTVIYYITALLSDRYTNRFLPLILFAPITALGYILLLCPLSPAIHYFSTFLVATGCYVSAGINFSWLASNTAPDGKRAATVGIQQAMAQISGIVSGQIYQAQDAPAFRLGHAWSLGSIVAAWLGWWGFWAVLKRREQGKREMRRNIDVLVTGRAWDDRAVDFKYHL